MMFNFKKWLSLGLSALRIGQAGCTAKAQKEAPAERPEAAKASAAVVKSSSAVSKLKPYIATSKSSVPAPSTRSLKKAVLASGIALTMIGTTACSAADQTAEHKTDQADHHPAVAQIQKDKAAVLKPAESDSDGKVKGKAEAKEAAESEGPDAAKMTTKAAAKKTASASKKSGASAKPAKSAASRVTAAPSRHSASHPASSKRTQAAPAATHRASSHPSKAVAASSAPASHSVSRTHHASTPDKHVTPAPKPKVSAPAYHKPASKPKPRPAAKAPAKPSSGSSSSGTYSQHHGQQQATNVTSGEMEPGQPGTNTWVGWDITGDIPQAKD